MRALRYDANTNITTTVTAAAVTAVTAMITGQQH
jgi:hypothetical protein